MAMGVERQSDYYHFDDRVEPREAAVVPTDAEIAELGLGGRPGIQAGMLNTRDQ